MELLTRHLRRLKADVTLVESGETRAPQLATGEATKTTEEVPNNKDVHPEKMEGVEAELKKKGDEKEEEEEENYQMTTLAVVRTSCVALAQTNQIFFFPAPLFPKRLSKMIHMHLTFLGLILPALFALSYFINL
jgi:hypothetical protein